jgi:hypothetical protein
MFKKSEFFSYINIKKLDNYKNYFRVSSDDHKNIFRISHNNINDIKIPHYEIIRKDNNKKKGLLFGSVHILPIHNIDIELRNKFRKCSDLVLEHVPDNSLFDYKKFISEYEDGIINKNKISMLCNNLNLDKKAKFIKILPQKKFYHPSAKMILPTNLINDFNNTNFFKELNLNVNDINIKNILSFTFKLLYHQGLDFMIYYHFLLNNKKIFGLDNNDDEYNREIDKFYNKCENYIFLLAIILRVLYGKKWVNMNIPNQELRKLYNDKLKQIKEDSYVIYKRNRIWLPKINNYMETLDYPLFVVGHAHISDLLDLLNDTNLYHIQKHE